MVSQKTGKPRRIDGSLIPRLVWWGIILLLSFIIIYPSVVLLINSFKADGGYGFKNYIRVLENPDVVKSIKNSMRVVLPSTVIATVLGVLLAWIVVRTDIPGKRLWQTLLVTPYLIPPFIGAISWTFLLGPVGHINNWYMAIFNKPDPLVNIYSIGGMIFVMSIYKYAVPYIVVLPTIKKIDASVEEAAKISGASTLRTLWDITLPLITPSILGGALLLFMFTLADFGVAAVLGAPNQITLMTTQIFKIIHRPDLPNNLQMAAANSIMLAVFGLVGLQLYVRLVKTDKFVVVSGKSASVEPTKLGKLKVPVLIFLTVVVLSTTFAPVMATLATALTKAYGLPLSSGNITIRNFVNLFQIQNVRRAFTNSLTLAATAGLTVSLISLIVAYMSVRGKVKGIGIMQTMIALPYAIPGTIIGLAMILAFANPLPITGWKLYGTIWVLLVAYVARFMNLGYNTLYGAVGQIDPSLEEASRISGATQTRSFVDVMFPLLKSSIYGAFFLVMMPALTEITLSALLWSVGNETIGVIVFSSQEEGKILITASLAVILITLVMSINFLIRKLGNEEVGI